MSSVDKASAYKDTVQPGIPRLGTTPSGWTRAPMSKHLYEERRPVDLQDDVAYDLVTVKRARGGVVRRDTKLGRDISVKTQFRVNAGDFLISKRQIVHGACGIVPHELDGSTVSNEYAVLRSHGAIDIDYLKYLSHSVYFQQTCFHSSIGVHIEKMIFKTEKWLDWEFDLPPLDEQQRIAAILSTWDAAIENSQSLIKASERQWQSAANMLLEGHTHLPGTWKPWRTTALSSIGQFRKGRGILKSDLLPSGIPAVRYGEIYTTHHFKIRGFQSFISRETAAQSERLRRGDILFTCSGETAAEIGKCVAFSSDIEAYAGGDLIILGDHGQSARFLGYALNSSSVTRQKTQLGQGNSVVHIGADSLGSLSFALPSVEEQEVIADVLDAGQELIVRLHARTDALITERKALLQQLLTGRRRVSTKKEAA
jgi:type I restriction enzyme S subunit